MKTTIKTLAITILAITTLFSCKKGETFRGSGTIITESRTVSTFDKIKSNSSIDVEVIYGTTQKVTVKADDNIIQNVYTFVSNSTLYVKLEEGNYRNTTFKVYVEIPTLKKISNSGSSDYKISGFSNLPNLVIFNNGSGDFDLNGTMVDFTIHNSGSGDFEINGVSDNFIINNSGSGDINGFDLSSKQCNIANSGSGDLEVFCSINLSGSNSGSGNIYYKGSSSVSISNSGSGSIVNAN